MRRAFTLAEVLCALALLGIVAVVAFAWLRDAGLLLRQTREAAHRERHLSAVTELLHDDLICALPTDGWTIDEEDGSLHLTTLAQTGATNAGTQTLRWLFDADRGRLARENRTQTGGVPRQRDLSDVFATWRFEREENGALIGCFTYAGTKDQTAKEERLLLWPGNEVAP